MKINNFFPSIWLGEFSDKEQYDAGLADQKDLFSVLDAIDDNLLISRHGFSLKAYCVACRRITRMGVTWHYGFANAQGSMNPAWTETAVCEHCGLNSRMRALLDFLLRKSDISLFHNVYMAESTTPSFRAMKTLWTEVIGSEFLGPEYLPGQTATLAHSQEKVRHEDLTRLSFKNDEFDLIITQDVFEHIPDYHAAFAECVRVLSKQGMLVFTIPFFPSLSATQVRATVLNGGSIQHHLPPEFHGNPVSNQGSLCFQNFGWDILPSLIAAGFREAKASLYWGPWQGHLGFPFFVFSAVR
jgi:hypothetical protein